MGRFVIYNRSAIEQAPLQTYYSALLFVPTRSIIRKQFEDHIPRWVRRLPKVESNWNALLQTLEGHKSFVTAVAFSLDSKTLASVSTDGMVKLWDSHSGAVLQTFKSRSRVALAIAFSLDGKTLVLASRKGTIKLLDTCSGAVLQALKVHPSDAQAMAFSLGGKTLASALNRTVKLWDTRSGALIKTFGSYSGYAEDVAFSPDGKMLALASDNGTVILWDTHSSTVLQTLKAHSDSRAVAFSPDGKTLASASDDKTIKLWNAQSDAVLQILEGHDSGQAIAFSPDGRTLASGWYDGIIKLWNTHSGTVLQTLEGHSRSIGAIAFSPDGKTLVSTSRDGMVKLWDASSETKLWDAYSDVALQTLKAHPDDEILSSASDDSSDKFMSHWFSANVVAFSPDGNTLASVFDKTVELWDTRSGEVLQTLKVDSDINNLSFSDDGTFFQTDRGKLYNTFLSSDETLSTASLSPSIFVDEHWVSWNGGKMLYLPYEHRPICVAVQGDMVALGYHNGRVQFMEFAF